jgi:hypothetical protein
MADEAVSDDIDDLEDDKPHDDDDMFDPHDTGTPRTLH